MSVALGCVEEQIADTCPRNVLVLLSNVGKHDATGDFCACPHESCLLEVRLAKVGES